MNVAQAATAPRATPEPRPPGSGGWIRRLMPFLMAHRSAVYTSFGVALAAQIVAAIEPLLMAQIIDKGLTQHQPILIYLVALVVTASVSLWWTYIRRWRGGQFSLFVMFDLRNAIYERLQRLDFAGHDQMHTGQLVSRSSSDVTLIQGLLQFMPIMAGNVIMVALTLVIMLFLSPPLALLMFIALPLLLAVAMRLRSTVFPATWDAQQHAGVVAGVVDEAVSGVRVVKGFGQEDRELAHLGDAARDLYSSRARLVRVQARYTPILAAIPSFTMVAILGLGGWLVTGGHISYGTFFAFMTYVALMVPPVRMLAGLFAIGQQARAGADRVLDILDTNPLITEKPDAIELAPALGDVRFEDVRFGYTADQPVLEHFDLHVAPGEVVALVGSSGSGKSTVTALLPRFYDVGAGRITVDGVDVRDATLDSLRHQVGVVFEEAFLFSESVGANIAYARPDAGPAEIEAAAAAAGAAGFIGELPDGYDTVVGERGLTLSGGQRQRIALARAILTNPRILVLDDATSAVDATTEEAIHDTLRSLMVDRTTILIAHRRSTLRLARRIVVIDHGRVVAEGTHEQLMAQDQRYRNLLAGPEATGATTADDDLEAALADLDQMEEREALAELTALDPVDGLDLVPIDAGDITPEAWPSQVVGDGPRPMVAGVARLGPGGNRGGGGPMGGPMGGAALAATPELLAALAKLPPADDQPQVDEVEAAVVPPGEFKVRRFVKPWTRWLAFGFGLVMADALLSLLGPFFVRRGLDQGVAHDHLASLWWTTALFGLSVGLDWIVTWAYTWITGRTSERMLFALRIKIFSHLQSLSLDYYDTELDGRVMTRMTTDVDALSQLVQTGLINALVGVLTCVGVFVFLIILSPPLALAASSVLPPLIIATWWYRRRSSIAYAAARESIADVNANLQESLSGVRVAQAYVREDRNISGFRDVNRRYLTDRLGAQRLIAIYFPFVLFVADIGAVVVLATGNHLVQTGAVTTGVVIAFLLYLDQFFAPIQQLSQVLDTWQQAAASTAKIEELFTIPSGTPLPAHPVDPGHLSGEIRFEGVHFRYPRTVGEEALDDIELSVAPGETVALVGETGAGKSTIVKLVSRFYDPVAGVVRVDGIDLRDIDLGAYRRQIGIVPQEAFLFTGTLRDNIAYGRPDATDAQVEAAARAVGAHDFVAAQPGGYLAPVSERGRSLSAGQRQLIALARARLVDPAILLLDEATSQLDLASEARVQQAMSAVAEGRTTLLVAHRLPTARRADRILVIDRGRIVEQGTHDELLALDGEYAELWSAFATTASDPTQAGAATT
jgi:ATP-binding cassette, subfamily B, bacterial